MKLLGHDFGQVPMGFHQVIAFRPRAVAACTCDPSFDGIAVDVDCPTHGLIATIERERIGGRA